ncbi:hypothetical protein KSS87_012749 [Heliosperma pusillum]|nr:hypothetical protein KSS87_012749 [Heliosperma pusillum]
MEMSSVLKSLKFMQRAAQKEEKTKKEEEEPKENGNFVPPSNVNRKCMVIMEGDPQPGTVRGRMSFQQFNPLIDKLKEEAVANGHEAEASTSSAFQSGRSNEREKRPSDMELDDNYLNGEHKRKQPKAVSQKSHPKKLQKNGQGNKQPFPNDDRSSHKQPKRDKLDFNVLVPQKSHNKRKGR